MSEGVLTVPAPANVRRHPALRGSYTPLVTPFTATGDIDLDTFSRLVDRQVTAGSHGVVVNGTTAEPSLLSVKERTTLVREAINVTDGRIPVIAATGSQSLAETLELTAAAETAGADALLVVTPYYVNPPQRGLIRYFTTVAGTTALPVLIYHIPVRAGVSMPPSSVADVVEQAPNVVGVKHAANDLGYVTELLHRLGPEFRVMVGLEELSYPMMAVGASGLVNAVANVAPKTVARLAEAVAAGRHDEARALHDALFELNRAVFWDTNPIPIKYMMKRLGYLPNNAHRLPMAPAEPALTARLDTLLDRINLD